MVAYTSPIYVIIVLIGYVVLHHIYKPILQCRASLSREKQVLGCVLVLVLCLFSVQDSDYFHYKDYLISLSQGVKVESLEDVYLWIAKIVRYDYFLFRFIIWGGALFLFIKTCDRLECNRGLVLFFFVSMYLTKFSYSRASLAMAVGLYGFSLLINPMKVKVYSYILGIAIILVSSFFHKSAITFLPIYFLSLFPWGRKSYIVFLLSLPIIYILLSTKGIVYLFSMDNESVFDYNTAISYLSKEQVSMGIAAKVQRILERIPYYIMLLIIMKDIFSQSKKIDYQTRTLMNFSLIVILISSLFLFDFGGNNTTIIYYRFLYYSILPLSILMSKLYESGVYNRTIIFTQSIGYVSVIYAILYSAYNMYILIN